MRRAIALICVSLLAATACGASIQAVYEGDVRFEHCMALDARTDIKPTLRRACWEEWVKFYTFGQTRDRVEFAKLRQKQLSTSSDFDEGDWSPSPRAQAAVPEPTSALAPPPMRLATDGGLEDPFEEGADGGAPDAAPVQVEPPGATCAKECEGPWNSCKLECKTPACEKNCIAKYKRCMRKCF